MSILDNLNTLGKKAQEYAGVAVDKARDLAEAAADKAKSATDTAKLNMAILTEQRELEENYRAGGREGRQGRARCRGGDGQRQGLPRLRRGQRGQVLPPLRRAHGRLSRQDTQKKNSRHGRLFFFSLFYCFTHSSEEEMPMSSSSDSRALSSFHVMVPPLRA